MSTIQQIHSLTQKIRPPFPYLILQYRNLPKIGLPSKRKQASASFINEVMQSMLSSRNYAHLFMLYYLRLCCTRSNEEAVHVRKQVQQTGKQHLLLLHKQEHDERNCRITAFVHLQDQTNSFFSEYHNSRNFAHLLFENPLKFFDHGRIYGTIDRFTCLQVNFAMKFQFKEYYSMSIHVYDTARHILAVDYCLSCDQSFKEALSRFCCWQNII